MREYYRKKREQEREALRRRSRVQTINDFIDNTCSTCENRESDRCNIRRNVNNRLVCDGEKQIDKGDKIC